MSLRREDAKTGAEQLHLRLTLLRLANASLSCNAETAANSEETMSEAWRLVQRLESQRKKRILH